MGQHPGTLQGGLLCQRKCKEGVNSSSQTNKSYASLQNVTTESNPSGNSQGKGAASHGVCSCCRKTILLPASFAGICKVGFGKQMWLWIQADKCYSMLCISEGKMTTWKRIWPGKLQRPVENVALRMGTSRSFTSKENPITFLCFKSCCDHPFRMDKGMVVWNKNIWTNSQRALSMKRIIWGSSFWFCIPIRFLCWCSLSGC